MRQQQKIGRVTMPKWPAWVLFGTMAACAYPAVSASTDRGAPAQGQISSLASALVP